MARIIYYVAMSVDGFISGLNDDISDFNIGGNGIDKYLADLQEFKTVIMGRKTYEFGYKFGLTPGQPAYPHMRHHIFSNSLKIENIADLVRIEPLEITRVKEIKNTSETDIYLCGGGEFAGWLLENDLVDQLKIKLNPISIGQGIPLFGKSTKKAQWKLIANETYDNGLLIITYELVK